MPFRFEGKIFGTDDEVVQAVLEAHPEVLDDDLPDFLDAVIEEIDDDELNSEEFADLYYHGD